MSINLSNAGLPIHPVLECGYIIFAHANYGNMRIVSFENPMVCDQSILEAETINKSHFGSGETLEIALNQALHSYHKNHSADYKNMYNTKERSYQIISILKKLDQWLVERQGKLRAFSDFDGSILVQLTGLTDVQDKNSPTVTLHGCGNNFYNALFSAFAGSFDHQNYATPVKQIELKTIVDEKPVEKILVLTKKTINITPKLKIQKRSHLTYNS